MGRWCTFLLLLCSYDAAACAMKDKLVVLPVVAGDVAVDAPAEELPAPAAEVVEVIRGISADHASCDDVGLLTVVIEWPRGEHRLADIGFEFSPVDDVGYEIFPTSPVSGIQDRRRSEFIFMWRDGSPAQQKPIDVLVDVRAVTADNRRGPPSRIHVQSNPGT